MYPTTPFNNKWFEKLTLTSTGFNFRRTIGYVRTYTSIKGYRSSHRPNNNYGLWNAAAHGRAQGQARGAGFSLRPKCSLRTFLPGFTNHIPQKPAHPNSHLKLNISPEEGNCYQDFLNLLLNENYKHSYLVN